MATFLIRPQYLKEADLLAANARKLLHRRKDLLKPETYAEGEAEIEKLQAAAKSADPEAVQKASDSLEKVFTRFAPPREDSAWRENCEVLLVAFVIAIGIRAYFLQPFKIPTGSMQPTLNGIIGHAVDAGKPLPGFVGQTFGSIFLGRSYVNAVADDDLKIVSLEPVTKLGFMTYTRIVCDNGRVFTVHAPIKTVASPNGQDGDGFGVNVGRRYRRGESIVHGYVDTGDQVFVDKFSYNFRAPRRSDVFVFNTRGIPGIRMDDPMVKSQFYIKRLAGLPGDTLRIEEPRLFIDGAQAHEFGFERVQAAKDGYRGYSNMSDFRFHAGQNPFHFLCEPQDEFKVPRNSYFALGDNSFNSSDSRAWGRVPAENLVGRGLFVYWPFTRHWGLIR